MSTYHQYTYEWSCVMCGRIIDENGPPENGYISEFGGPLCADCILENDGIGWYRTDDERLVHARLDFEQAGDRFWTHILLVPEDHKIDQFQQAWKQTGVNPGDAIRIVWSHDGTVPEDWSI